MTLIDVDTLKQYIGDCKCCDKCPNKRWYQYECYYECNFPDFLTEEWERVLDEQPTIEAIPIKWLEEKLTGHPELPYAITDGISNVLDLWKAEQEEQHVGKDT